MRIKIITIQGCRIIPCMGGFFDQPQVEQAVSSLVDTGIHQSCLRIIRLPRRIRLQRATWQDIRWALNH